MVPYHWSSRSHFESTAMPFEKSWITRITAMTFILTTLPEKNHHTMINSFIQHHPLLMPPPAWIFLWCLIGESSLKTSQFKIIDVVDDKLFDFIGVTMVVKIMIKYSLLFYSCITYISKIFFSYQHHIRYTICTVYLNTCIYNLSSKNKAFKRGVMGSLSFPGT